MTYDEAVALAMSETRVMRPHWHFCALTSRIGKGVGQHASMKRILVICDEEGTKGDRYKPGAIDQAATDWMVAP